MQKRMDWRAITFDWNRVRAFLVTAEEGSLSAAARALGLAQPTLGRQVAALERELGVALFERTGRGLALTPGGLDLVEHARAMGEAATRLSLAASGQSQSLEGPVCISASEVYSAYLLPPVLRRLREEEPGIEIEVLASNSLSDLRRREADIALRNTRPTDPDLVARRLRDDAAHLYAAPAYLDRLGAPPRGPDDLADAQFIGFDRDGGLIEALNARGFALTQRNFPVLSANHLVQCRACGAPRAARHGADHLPGMAHRASRIAHQPPRAAGLRPGGRRDRRWLKAGGSGRIFGLHGGPAPCYHRVGEEHPCRTTDAPCPSRR